MNDASTSSRASSCAALSQTYGALSSARAALQDAVQQGGRGGADVERSDPPAHRQRDERVAGGRHARPQAPSLRAQDEHDGAVSSRARCTAPRRRRPRRRPSSPPPWRRPGSRPGCARARSAGARPLPPTPWPRRAVTCAARRSPMTTPSAPAHSAVRHDRAEVLRVLDLVERDDQRRGARKQLGGVRVRVAGRRRAQTPWCASLPAAPRARRRRRSRRARRALRATARARRPRSPTRGARAAGPRAAPRGPGCGRRGWPRLARPGARAVRGGAARSPSARTSSAPPGASRTCQPRAPSSSRRRSASAKSRAARAASRRSSSSRAAASGAPPRRHRRRAGSRGPGRRASRAGRRRRRRPRRLDSRTQSKAAASASCGVEIIAKCSEEARRAAAAMSSGESPGMQQPRGLADSGARRPAPARSVSVGVLHRLAVVAGAEEEHERVAAPASPTASASDSMLPTLLAIFSPPSCSIPLCIQIWASSAPRPARVCAASFSWCGKVEVVAAAVDLEADAEQLLGHRRALDVPARAPAAPGRVPGGVLALLLRLPEREIERVLLAIGALDALALVHVVDGAVAERAVAGVGAHAEVDVAVDRVGAAVVDQRLDQVDDRADRLAGQRLGVGPAELEQVGVLDVVRGHLARELVARAGRAAAPRRRSCR